MYITKYTLQNTFVKTTNYYCFNHNAFAFKVQVELKLNCSLTFISMQGKKFKNIIFINKDTFSK